MNYEELNQQTRQQMLAEFEKEQVSPDPYRSKRLSPMGRTVFPELMRTAINVGSEVSLATSLQDPSLWKRSEEYTKKDGAQATRKVNPAAAAEALALSEFNTWYVRGLAARLLSEGVSKCQVYRGAEPKWEHGECSAHEGRIVEVQEIYDAHRRRYWPEPGDPEAFAIPYAPGCHHVIRRIAE